MSKSQIDALKASIAAKGGTAEDMEIRADEFDAKTNDIHEWNELFIDHLVGRMKQMVRSLDDHVPDWRKRVTFPKMAAPPG
jgi:hypothetical protein